MMRTALIAAVLPLLPAWALAHEGHGAAATSHWHATDTWGLVVSGAGVVLALWFARRK